MTINDTVLRTLDFILKERPTIFNTDLTIPSSGTNRRFIYVTDNTPHNATVTLPDATKCAGSWITITNIGWTGSVLTIFPVNNQEIYGSLCYNASQYTLLTQGSIEIVSNGSYWVCIQGSGSDVFVETGWNANSWYRKLSSDFVIMGGVSIIPANNVSVHVTLPLALRKNDFPVVIITPNWGNSSVPALSYFNGNSTGFDVFRSDSNEMSFNWFGYGYWR